MTDAKKAASRGAIIGPQGASVGFSVIIPTYNRAPLLRDGILSVLSQEVPPLEIIVVDDGSSDGTDQVVKEFAGRIKYLKQQNQGPGAARNLGAAHATGDYLAFLDSDDLFFPWTLAVYERLVGAHNHPVFIAGKPFRFSERTQLNNVRSGEVAALWFSDYFASGDEWRWWGVSSFVVQRNAFLAVNGFLTEPVNGEDAELALRLGTSPGFVQCISPSTFAYREHAISAMKNVAKTAQGMWIKVQREREGAYPGGSSRARERWRILLRHLRPVTLECLREGLKADAWGLYRASFRWHVALRRWKYLIGFPVKALTS